jgi:fatty acid-binding protein DegV
MCQEFVKLNKSNKLTKESIEKYLAENKDDVAGALIIPEVKYLTRSGRLTPIKGAVAQMLGYKIVISYTDAGLQMFNKTRDTDKLADIAYDVIKATLKNFDQKKITHFSLGINGYSNRHFNLVEIKKNVANKFNLPSKVKPYNLNLSSIITCHTGPNYVVLCVKAKKN